MSEKSSIVVWRVRSWSIDPERKEYDRETTHFYVNGRRRDAKVSSFHKYFSTIEEAQAAIDSRKHHEAAMRAQRKRVSAFVDHGDAIKNPEAIPAMIQVLRAVAAGSLDMQDLAIAALAEMDPQLWP